MRLPNEMPKTPVQRSQFGAATLATHGAEAVQRLARSLLDRTLSRRDCKYGSASACEKPVSNNTGVIAAVLGAVIPVACAIIVILFLHRRIKRKQQVEDANDPHKSLDFGVGLPIGAPGIKRKGRKGEVPEMIITEDGLDSKHNRGLSMDMLGSPYMLPAGLHGSRESLRSMSRSVQDEHDPYRPVTWARQSSEESKRSPRFRPENGSIYSASTLNATNEHANLVSNARPMSQSHAVRAGTMSPREAEYDGAPLDRLASSSDRGVPPRRPLPEQNAIPLASDPTPPPPPKDSESPLQEEVAVPLPPMPEEDTTQTPPPRTSSARKEPPANIVVPPLPSTDRQITKSNSYEDDSAAEMPYPEIMEPDGGEYDGYDFDPSLIQTGRFSIDNSAPSQQYPVQTADNRVSVMGLRPLPPDNPEENAEQRANRIRSFYREYFDDSKPNPSGHYEEDLDGELLDGAIYDPETGSYFFAGERPFAQPLGRRAMTPPPASARFAPGPHGRAFSTMSAGRRPNPRPGPAMQPKKKLPPPKPLKSLPTPHLLKEDTMVLTPIDFAPPSTFRDAQNGRRPDSPMGLARPFSPNVRAYSPLASASDELSVMPSPHHLRKSGTFTGLDFAKLPRFRGQEGTASDAGSIRSARSGISALQIDAVRAGAYRVSRIPKEMVTTREDLASQLRPKMNLINPA